MDLRAYTPYIYFVGVTIMLILSVILVTIGGLANSGQIRYKTAAEKESVVRGTLGTGIPLLILSLVGFFPAKHFYNINK